MSHRPPAEHPDTTGLRIREAARAILLTPDRRVLLVRFEFPAGTRWALPGGGLDPGETALDGLHRELAEELGLTDVAIGPHVWTRLHVIRFLNGVYDGQREQIHLVPVAEAFEPQPHFTWEQLNAEFVFELRWWALDEIDTATAAGTIFAPSTLGPRLRDLVDHGPPESPLAVEA